MPQLPRQFAQQDATPRISADIPQASSGQGLAALGTGLQRLSSGLATLSGLREPMDELALLKSRQHLTRALNDLRGTFKDADTSEGFIVQMRENADVTMGVLEKNLSQSANAQTVKAFLREASADLEAFDKDVLKWSLHLDATNFVVDWRSSVDEAISSNDQKKFQQAMDLAKKSGLFTAQEFDAEFKAQSDKFKAAPHYKRINEGQAREVLNDIALGNLDDLDETTREAVETEAHETLTATRAEEDRAQRQLEREREANLQSLQLQFDNQLYEVFTIDASQIPEGSTIPQVQLARLDDIERRFTRRVQSIDAETGNVIVAVPEDLVSSNREQINGIRTQIIQGKTAASELAFRALNSQIDNTLSFSQAAKLKAKIRQHPDLSPDHHTELMNAIRVVTNNQFGSIMDEQDRRIHQLLELDSLINNRILEGQLATRIAQDEYHAWVRKNLESLKSGDLQFEDGVRPIVNRARRKLGENFRVRAENIRPFVAERLEHYLEQVRLIASLSEIPPELQHFTPQDMVLREVASGRLTAARGQSEIAWLDLMQVSGGANWSGAESLKAGAPETGDTPRPPGGTTFKQALKNVEETLREYNEAFQRMLDEQMKKFGPIAE